MSVPAPTIADEFDAAIKWWHAAGVDMDFNSDATDWLGAKGDAASETANEAAPRASNPGALPADPAQSDVQKNDDATADLLGESPPQDLASFQEWWLTAPGIDPIGPRGRIAPRGVAEARLMALVLDPEVSDTQQLLSGPHGRLLDRIQAAMGIADDDIYIASVLTRHTPVADPSALLAGGMGQVLMHHVALARPECLLVFGTNILPLLGHEAAQGTLNLQKINQKLTPENNLNKPLTPFLVTESLESLAASPRLKARFWRRWIEWSADR